MNQNEPSGWRKKPVVIEAMRFTHESSDACREWIGPVFDGWQLAYEPHRPMLRIRTLDGVMEASEGDWIIRGGLGGFYPCKPDIFAATYEPAAAAPSAPVAPEPDGPILKAPWMAFDPREQDWYNVPTQAEAVAKANELVDDCCVDGGWDEEVTEIVVAKVTHVAVKRLLHTRTDDMTDEQWYGLCGPFSSEHREWFTYDIVPVAAGVPSTPQAPDDRQGDCDEPRTEIHGFLGDYEVIHPSAATVPVVPEPLADRLGASVAIPVESLAEGAAIHAARTAPVVPEEPAADEILHPACLVPGGMCWPITGRCHNCRWPAPVADVEPQADRDGPWRKPAAETTEYPGLWVHDGRQSGAITFDASRLPISTCPHYLTTGGWEAYRKDYEQITEYGWTGDLWADFLCDLFELRGDFARLILTLADLERVEADRRDADEFDAHWWDNDADRARAERALLACLDAIGCPPVSSAPDVEPQPDVEVRPCGCGRPMWSEEAEEEFDAVGEQYDPTRWCPHWSIEDVRTDRLAPGDLYAVQGDIPLAVSWWEVAAVGEPDPDLCAVWYVEPGHPHNLSRARTNHASPDHLFHVLRLGMVGRQTIAPASSAPDVLRMPAEVQAAWVIETALTEWASGQDEAADECSDESSRDELRRQATTARKFAAFCVAAPLTVRHHDKKKAKR